jgi:hypothetical protein
MSQEKAGLRFYSGRIAELPPGDRERAERLYRRAKILVAAGVTCVLIPFWVLVALTPDPGVPSQSHLLPFELFLVGLAVGVGFLAAGIVTMTRVRRAVGLPAFSW